MCPTTTRPTAASPAPVALEELAGQYVSGMHFTSALRDGKWHAAAEVSAENLEETPFEGSLELRLDDQTLACLPVHLEAGEKAVLATPQIPRPDAEAWSPENPRLYLLSAILYGKDGGAVDDLIDRVGFREVRTEGKDILLNGRKLSIRGFCRHEDHPQFGCSLPWSAMCRDLSLMRDLGANSVRTSHYPNDELFLDLCDETGMLVWEENSCQRPFRGGHAQSPTLNASAEDCIREMIGAHYNHHFHFYLGYSERTVRQPYASTEGMLSEAAGADPQPGSDPSPSFASCQFKTDICFDLVDVVSYNIYPLWYHDTPADVYLKDLYDWVQKETGGSGKPLPHHRGGSGRHLRLPDAGKGEMVRGISGRGHWKSSFSAILSPGGLQRRLHLAVCDCRVCDSWFSIRPRTMNNKASWTNYPAAQAGLSRTVKKVFSRRREGRIRNNREIRTEERPADCPRAGFRSADMV